jgi:glycosyltransferase involved in cell wall biosynthesis
MDAFGGLQASKWAGASFGMAITETLLAEVKAELGPNAPAVWGVAPMGVETDQFRRSRPYEPYRGTGRFRIFSCGRLNPAKGHDILIRAVAILRDRALPAELRIAGGDDRADLETHKALESLAAELGVRDAVTLLGPVPESTIVEELDRAHAFALATLTEGLGVATMEAMAFGLPAVSTRVGGVPELITSGVDGLLVEAGSVPALAEALETLARDPDLAERLGRAARQKIEAGFSPDRSAQLLLDLVRSTAG